MLGFALLLAATTVAVEPLQQEMQQLEWRRNAAIKSGDIASLEKLYAPDFHGIAANGRQVDRAMLFEVFKRNAGGDFVADSTILTARDVKGLVLVEGRLKILSGDRTRTLSDARYLHIFRRTATGWEMVGGAAVPLQQER